MKPLVEAGTRLGREHAHQHERFRLHWAEHVRRSRDAILRCAASVTTPESVTVLGAGSAYNIPLAELAATFGIVRLVDIDEGGLQVAVDALPPDARHRVEAHVADVTGGASTAVLEAGLECVAGSATPESALAGIAAFVGGAAAEIELGAEQLERWRAPCVISSCVGSQLALFPHREISTAFTAKFGAHAGARLFGESGLAQLRERWVRSHGEALAELVTPSGAIYWADTVAETPCLAAHGPAPLAAIVSSLATFLAKQKSADLRAFLTDAGKVDLATRFAQVAVFPLAMTVAGRVEQGDRLLQSFKAVLDATARNIVTWAIVTAVGENLIVPRRELEILEHIRSAAEQLHGEARQPILRTPFVDFFPANLIADGALESWIWINDPRAAATLEGGAYRVEAQILRPRTARGSAR